MQDKEQLHPEDKRNLIIFGVIALIFYVGYNHFILQPRMQRLQAAQMAAAQHIANPVAALPPPRARDEVLTASARLPIDNGGVRGSIALTGGRLDDLQLQRYYTSLQKTAHVTLLSPAGTAQPEYVELGWLSANAQTKVPGAQSVWQIAKGSPATLTPAQPVTLIWDNGGGLTFERTFTIDKDYLISVKQRVINHGASPVTLTPYSLVSQHGLPDDMKTKSGRVFEGVESYLDGKLVENNYGALVKKSPPPVSANSGWIGISQKYWFTGLVPAQTGGKTFRMIYTPSADPDDAKNGLGKFQVDVTEAPIAIAAGASGETTMRIFAGAKELKLLEHYATSLPVNHFDLVVDFGLYYFLTKPFFYILDFIGHLTGNFGVAIILLTVLVRLAVFPLANTSFRSFAKMKKIGPQMKELREKHGQDRVKLQESLVKLYEQEKVNPMAGCLPLVIQIPIFFALYKVLSVTIETRHAPFAGWIHDLSAQDPTNIFNGFGLIPWTPPAWLPAIGAWSCLMLLAMLAQRRLSPTPQDPMQAASQNFMPFFVTYIMSKFPAGLVIYWTFSNGFSVLQQYVIMRSLGVEVHLFSRAKDDKEMDKLVREGPNVHPELIVAEDEVADAITVSPPKKKHNLPKKKK